MSFFDELGQKISDASRAAAEKAKDIAEITHINSVLKEKESQKDSLFYELGKAFFDSHKNDGNCEFGETVASLRSLCRETELLRDSLLDLKGLVKCPYCSEEFDADENECPSCGMLVPRRAKQAVSEDGEEQLVCGACGHRMRVGSNFCIMCGTPVKKDEEHGEDNTAVKSEDGEPVRVTGDEAVRVTGDEPVRVTGNESVRVTGDEAVRVTGDEAVRFSDNEPVHTADNELDEIAAKAAAEISRITAEKKVFRTGHENIPFARRNNENEPKLPDFTPIDGDVVDEDSPFTDFEDKKPTPNPVVVRPPLNARKCTFCGAPLIGNAEFCRKCGSKTQKKQAATHICPCCGAFIGRGVAFCPECGNSVK